MSPAQPRPRVLRVKINNPAVVRLLKDEVLEDIMEWTNKVLEEIKDIYKDENGNSYQWEVKYDKQARAKRLYGVVYCMDESLKYKEAKHGLIAKHLKSMTYRGKIKLTAVAGSIIIS
jgi:hypothetical protein